MDISRRELFSLVILTGLDALVNDAVAFQSEQKGYNHLIPDYDKDKPIAKLPLGRFLGVEHYALQYAAKDDIITKYYVGPDNYAIEIRKKESGGPARASIILLDDGGYGVFRKKIDEFDEHGKPNSWGPPQWIRLKHTPPREKKKV